MNENIVRTLEFYCQNELNDLMTNNLFISLKSQVEDMGFSIECDFGKEKDSLKSNDLYLSVSVLDEHNEFIEIYDDEFLTIATKLVSEDKNGKIKFYSWKDEEFLEGLNWVINQLTKYAK